MTQYKVDAIEALKKRDRADEALALLKRVAAQVQPVMHTHQWRVPLLKEFFPKSAGLLGMNVNRGQKILIRLRPPHAPNSFFPYEHLLGTMLHELCHMKHGPVRALGASLSPVVKAGRSPSDTHRGTRREATGRRPRGTSACGCPCTRPGARWPCARSARRRETTRPPNRGSTPARRRPG